MVKYKDYDDSAWGGENIDDGRLPPCEGSNPTSSNILKRKKTKYIDDSAWGGENIDDGRLPPCEGPC